MLAGAIPWGFESPSPHQFNQHSAGRIGPHRATFIKSRAVSSAGQSVCLTSRRSEVRVLYRPPLILNGLSFICRGRSGSRVVPRGISWCLELVEVVSQRRQRDTPPQTPAGGATAGDDAARAPTRPPRAAALSHPGQDPAYALGGAPPGGHPREHAHAGRALRGQPQDRAPRRKGLRLAAPPRGPLPAPHRPQVRGPGARHRGVGR